MHKYCQHYAVERSANSGLFNFQWIFYSGVSCRCFPYEPGKQGPIYWFFIDLDICSGISVDNFMGYSRNKVQLQIAQLRYDAFEFQMDS